VRIRSACEPATITNGIARIDQVGEVRAVHSVPMRPVGAHQVLVLLERRLDVAEDREVVLALGNGIDGGRATPEA
jgi:hypothetical protein